MSRGLVIVVAAIAAAAAAELCAAQPSSDGRVSIAWDRYSDWDQTAAHVRAIAAAYPDLVTLRVLGRSLQGREILLAIVTSPKTGPDTSKPAMWIDGNVHGNEVQACEVVLYTLWYLTRDYGRNPRITELVDNYAFYLLPSANPDGRQYWFEKANNPHTSRHNQRPTDQDRDGAVDEDGPDDLDGDGHITQMWKEAPPPTGRWVRSVTDERVFVRLRDDQSPAPGVKTYAYLGDEGIDNDGDGRINEDGPFGDDMNRNCPSDWQPEYIQFGAGPYPLSAPETAAVAGFLLEHPNIAAVQSYHNTGGMVLRGPGAAYRERMYPHEDLRVYDEIARTGELLLPYYRYLIIHSQLYRVHGGFVTWASEGLGTFAYTNELWTAGKYFQRENVSPAEEQLWLWRDRVAFGELFVPYRPYEHPQYGTVLVGGMNKWSSRVTPGFMLQEECHRNFAFTMYHADQMPVLSFGRVEVAPAGTGSHWRIRAEVVNSRLMPTRTALRRRERIGWPDLAECIPRGGAASVVAASTLSDWLDLNPVAVAREPARVLVDEGIPGRGGRVLEFIVEGLRGTGVTIRYTSQWARVIEREITLESTQP